MAAAYGNNADALLNHFISFGVKEGRSASAEFNPQAYRQRYEDLQACPACACTGCITISITPDSTHNIPNNHSFFTVLITLPPNVTTVSSQTAFLLSLSCVHSFRFPRFCLFLHCNRGFIKKQAKFSENVRKIVIVSIFRFHLHQVALFLPQSV